MAVPKKPLGARIRELINPALDDSRKPDIQLGILNNFFEQVTIAFPRALESGFTDVFNHAATFKPDDKNVFLLEALTQPQGYLPLMRLQIPVSLPFTEFTPAVLKELPAYILLHEAARSADVAVKIIGLMADEVKGSSGLMPAFLIIDGSKSYEQGALEASNIYPNLPEIPAEFDRQKSKGFKFKGGA